MSIKNKLKLETFVEVNWSYDKRCLSIIKSNIQLVDHSIVMVWISAYVNPYVWFSFLG